MIQVNEMMTKNPVTLSESDSLADVFRLMNEYDIRHIPILNSQNQLIGLVSQRDALSAQESLLTSLQPEQREVEERAIPVTRFMTSNVATVTPKAGLREAALYLQKHKFGCLPVLKSEALVGIITESDFVEVAINLLEIIEDQAMPEQDEL